MHPKTSTDEQTNKQVYTHTRGTAPIYTPFSLSPFSFSRSPVLLPACEVQRRPPSPSNVRRVQHQRIPTRRTAVSTDNTATPPPIAPVPSSLPLRPRILLIRHHARITSCALVATTIAATIATTIATIAAPIAALIIAIQRPPAFPSGRPCCSVAPGGGVANVHRPRQVFGHGQVHGVFRYRAGMAGGGDLGTKR